MTTWYGWMFAMNVVSVVVFVKGVKMTPHPPPTAQTRSANIDLIFCSKKILENSADTDKKETEDSSSSSRKPSLDVGVGCTGTDQSKEGVARVINNPIVVDDLYSHRNVVEIPFQRLMSAR